MLTPRHLRQIPCIHPALFIADLAQQLLFILKCSNRFFHMAFTLCLVILCTFAIYTCASSSCSYLDKPNCKAVRLFAMDFSKVFDCVNHEMLSNKLKRVPLDPHIINSYLSFFDNRQQRVVYNSFEGQQKTINKGTTQGSVNDPYLFNILINDLELVLGNQPALFKYADDSSIIVLIWSNGLSRRDLVDEFLTWTNCNKMVCNPVKCKELVFRKSNNYNDNIAQIHNIRQCNDLRLLRVTFQSNCTYNHIVKSKLIKAKKCL